MTFPRRLAFGKRSGRAGSLALGFTSDVVSLYARENGGDWKEVGSATISAPDFAEQMEALRVEALVRDKSQSPITIWLPADQVIERHYTLAATSGDARWAEAARRIADETPHSANELSVSIASDSRFEPVKVLAVLLQTMIEARSYVAGWGFTPGRISTRVGRHGFATAEPLFEFPRSAANRAGRIVSRLAVAASALVLIGGAAFAAYELARPLFQTPVPVSLSGPAPSSFAVFMDPPPGPQMPLSAVAKTAAANLGLPKLRTDPEVFAPSAGTAGYSDVRAAITSRGLTMPTGTDPLRIGAAPVAPRFGPLGQEVDAVENGNTIRLAALDPVAPVPEPTDTTSAVRPVEDAEPAPTDAEPAGEATEPDSTDEAPAPDLAESDAAERDDPELAPTEFAPERVAALPRPRPGTTGVDTADTTGLVLPEPRPEALVEAPPAPPAADEARASDDASTTAVVTPDPRPQNLAARAGIAETTLRDDRTATDKPEAATGTDDRATEESRTAALAPTTRPEPVARPEPLARPESLVRTKPTARTETATTPDEPIKLAVAPPADADLNTDPPEADTSDVAAVKAPEPSKRPRTLEFAARRMPARTRTPLSVYLPRSVGDAARRTGLALDKTNLIGVIEAKDGRQALVRLPNGGYRKVGQGDNLDGWRVSVVNRESVRLTRKGEKRTLLLAAP